MSYEKSKQARITKISANSEYYKYRNLLISKSVRLVEKSKTGFWYCEFIFDEDRRALNEAAGWSNNKNLYLLDNVQFKNIKQ